MKKILSLLVTIGMCFSLLVGCNLFTINPDKYYSQVVATAGGHEFTMQDLLDAYDLYGSNYTNNGQSYEEAIKSSLDDMIDKALLIDYIKENNLVVLTDADYNDIKASVYESIQSSITSIEDQIKVERGLDEEDEEDEESAEESAEEESTPYVSKFKINQDKLNNTGIFDIERVVDVDPDYGKDPGQFVQLMDIAYPDISEEAMSRYIKTLQSKARQYNRSDSEADVKAYENDRLTRIFTENKYIEKLQENYYLDVNAAKKAVVDKYVSDYAEDYVTYYQENYTYNTKMSGYASSYAGDMYYHPEVNYMSVSHILLKYNKTTETQIASLKKKLDENNPEYTEEDYEADVLRLSEGMEVKYEENGETKYATASQIFARIQNEIDSIDSTDLEGRAKKFYELMDIFNEDEGITTAKYGYLIPLKITDSNGASDSMIEEFAEDSRSLNKANPTGGNISEVKVLGSYGYHIIFNMGEIKNLFTPEEMKNPEEHFEKIWSTLYKTNTTLISNTSLFDSIYDGLNTTDDSLFNTYAENLTKSAKAGIEIKKYESRYDDLWK